jgi:hypothetical protein
MIKPGGVASGVMFSKYKNLYSLAEPANVRDDFQSGKEAENAVYSASTQVLRRRRRAENQPDRHRFRL